MFSNRLDDLIDSSNKENVIIHYQNRNTISLQILAIEKNKVAGHFELKEQIESIKRDISDINFLY